MTTSSMTPAAVARDIAEREHELYPDEEFQHLNCRVCGPGPLKQGEVPSSYEHIFYSNRGIVHNTSYGSWMEEKLYECLPEYATSVSSELDSERGQHTIMLDVDMAARCVETSTPGHHHIYIDLKLPWWKYRRLLKALYKAGVIEKGFYKASIHRKATHLRPPWVKKENSEEGTDRR